MGVMGPREFEQYQARVAQDMDNLKTFFALTASSPPEETTSSLPPRERLKGRIEVQHNALRERVENLRNLDGEIRRRWLATLDNLDPLAPSATDDLVGEDALADRVSVYANGFPYHLGFSNYSAAHTLHMDLRNLASKILELAALCEEYQSLDQS